MPSHRFWAQVYITQVGLGTPKLKKKKKEHTTWFTANDAPRDLKKMNTLESDTLSEGLI
jgi:hypothetical protein